MISFRRLATDSLSGFDAVLGDQLERVPTGTVASFVRLARHIGLAAATRRAISACRHGAAPPDLRALVSGNLKRKQVRLPALFTLRPVAAAYLHFKAAQAALLRDALRAGAASGRIDIIFNGSVYPDSVLAAVSDPAARLFIEAGFFPDTMQADPVGLNGANSVPRDPAFYLDTPQDFAAAGLPDATASRAAKSSHPPVALPRRYVFVPFQVPSDMQITLHSPWLRDMRHFLAVIRDAADRNPSETFVIKEHPSFRASVMGLFPPHPRVVFANGNPTGALIAAARAVITINSTVGIEALQAAKPVITLGNACYAIDGLVLQARDSASLDAALARSAKWRPDERLRHQFLGFLRNVYLIPSSLHRPPETLARDLIARIEGQQAAWHIPTAGNRQRRRG